MSNSLNQARFQAETLAEGLKFSQDENESRNHLSGRRVGMVVLSRYPMDPRPRRVAATLVQWGMEVDYICITGGNDPLRESVNGLEVFRVPLRHVRGSKFAYLYECFTFITGAGLILAARSLRRRYDLVYINNMPDVLVASALFPKLLGSKVILDLHDPMPELMSTIFDKAPDSKSVRMLKFLEKWSIARANYVLTVNKACQREFTNRGCPPDGISVVMNAPDESIFKPKPPSAAPDSSQNANRPFVVMYHGSLVERNGPDLAVEAFAKACIKIPHAQLHVFGMSNPPTPFENRLMQLVRERGIEDNVVFFGYTPLDAIPKAIGECDVGLISNQQNLFTNIAMPTRIFEYLALGKPTISPRTPGVQDYFSEDSLLFFEAGNADDLASKIEFVANNPQLSREIVERGRQVYLSHTWEREKEKLLGVIAELFAPPSGKVDAVKGGLSRKAGGAGA